MALPDPRRLAAADMYGREGRPLRRRIVRAEFAAGAVVCVLLGALTLVRGGVGWTIVGIWLLGAGANYVPLAIQALQLSRPDALEAALVGVDLRRELRWAARAQLWIAVPFALCLPARR